jgi:Fur family transcriptional regulator, zinc uptake regulator
MGHHFFINEDIAMHRCDHAHPHPEIALLAAENHAGFTPLRRQILEKLASSAKPLGAYDLIDLIAKETGRTPAPVTIYRTLDYLLEHGFAHRIHALNAFIACSHQHVTGDIMFMVCETCGCVSEGETKPLTLPHGFKAKRTAIEIFGTCGHCI